MNTTTTTNKL